MAPHAADDFSYSLTEHKRSYQSPETSDDEEQSKSSESSIPEVQSDDEAQAHLFRDDVAIVGMGLSLANTRSMIQ